GGHAEASAGAFVDAAGGAEAGIIDGLGDVLGFAEAVFQFAHAAGFGVLLGGYADGGLEAALQMEAAEPGARGKFGEVVGRVGVGFDVAAEFLNFGGGGVLADFEGAAAQAGPQASALGVLGSRIESYVLAQGAA